MGGGERVERQEKKRGSLLFEEERWLRFRSGRDKEREELQAHVVSLRYFEYILYHVALQAQIKT